MIPARAIGIVALAFAGAATGVLASGHWAFQPIRHPQPPEVPSLHEPLDRFVAHVLRQRGSQLAPPTDRRSWIRRVTMDLTGLPATAEASYPVTAALTHLARAFARSTLVFAS
jgi:hypothetical protein